jgi:hypothetical protein
MCYLDKDWQWFDASEIARMSGIITAWDADPVVAKFCATLEMRPNVKEAAQVLRQVDRPKWRGESAGLLAYSDGIIASNIDNGEEENLSGVDMVVTFPGTSKSGGGMFSFLLFSAMDVGKPETIERIDRIDTRTGGKLVAVVFFLDNQHHTHAWQQLQLEYDTAIAPSFTWRLKGVWANSS